MSARPAQAEPEVAKKKTRPGGTLYRGNEGMWSWVLHRITGVAIFFFLLVHVLDTALIRVSPEAYNAVMGTYKQVELAGTSILATDRRATIRQAEVSAMGTVTTSDKLVIGTAVKTIVHVGQDAAGILWTLQVR